MTLSLWYITRPDLWAKKIFRYGKQLKIAIFEVLTAVLL